MTHNVAKSAHASFLPQKKKMRRIEEMSTDWQVITRQNTMNEISSIKSEKVKSVCEKVKLKFWNNSVTVLFSNSVVFFISDGTISYVQKSEPQKRLLFCSVNFDSWGKNEQTEDQKIGDCFVQ